jgi:hypothetical protein
MLMHICISKHEQHGRTNSIRITDSLSARGHIFADGPGVSASAGPLRGHGDGCCRRLGDRVLAGTTGPAILGLLDERKFRRRL